MCSFLYALRSVSGRVASAITHIHLVGITEQVRHRKSASPIQFLYSYHIHNPIREYGQKNRRHTGSARSLGETV
jgi:hypothetical protein